MRRPARRATAKQSGSMYLTQIGNLRLQSPEGCSLDNFERLYFPTTFDPCVAAHLRYLHTPETKSRLPAAGAGIHCFKFMKKYEYKHYYLKLKTGKKAEEQLLEALNAFGQEGWRLSRMYGEVSLRSLTSLKGGINLLLEREIQA